MFAKAGLLVLLTLGAFGAETNLVKNPDFEEGEKDPKYWDRCDGLTTFWENDPQRGGKCIRIYTNIDNNEFEARVKEMRLPNPPPPKKPREIKGIGYDTVGGNDGVHFFSDWIDVKPGMRYTLNADVRSDRGGAPKIFLKGYVEQPTELGDPGHAHIENLRRILYKGDVDCDAPQKWKTTTFTFCPTYQRNDVKWIRVCLYAYWPPQNYYFQKIKVVEAGLDPDAPKRWAASKAKEAASAKNEAGQKVSEARACLAYIRKAVERYKSDLGSYPQNLQGLLKDTGDPKWAGPYVLELADDPWGNAYKYKPAEKGYSLKSLGPDGEEGGGDDVE